MKTLSVVLASSLVMLSAACASGGSHSSSSLTPRRTYVSEILITETMIKASSARTAWDIIQNRAPQLLASTRNYHSMATGFGVAGQPLLVLDGSRTRDLSQLSQIPAEWVVAVHILNDTDGAMYFGTPGSYGVIVVETRQ